MASKLTKWINAQLKAKGKSSKEAQKDAGKYSSISAAKKAGSLYYTDKKGRVMIAAHAEDLAKPLPAPKKRPEVVKPEKRPEAVKTKKKKTETKKIDTVAKKPNSKTPDESSGGISKEKIKEPEVSVTVIKASPGPLKRKPTSKELDQDSLDRALRMDNRVEKERDDRRSRNKVEIVDGKRKVTKRKKDIRTSIEKESDLLKQELEKNYKRGRATKRARGGLIDMRKTGLFK